MRGGFRTGIKTQSRTSVFNDVLRQDDLYAQEFSPQPHGQTLRTQRSGPADAVPEVLSANSPVQAVLEATEEMKKKDNPPARNSIAVTLASVADMASTRIVGGRKKSTMVSHDFQKEMGRPTEIPTEPMPSNFGSRGSYLVTKAATNMELSSWNLRDFLKSPFFDFLVGLLVLGNAIFVGVQADGLARSREDSESDAMRITSSVFCWVFVSELLLRLLVFRLDFFRSSSLLWNIFDMAVVSSAVVEELMKVAGSGSSMSSVTLFRMMRILKLARVLRIFRVIGFFRELRIIVMSIATSLRSLVWTLLLLSMVCFAFGVYLTVVIAQSIADGSEVPVSEVAFNSVPQAMISLLATITGGLEWISVARELGTISTVYQLIFIAYICFAVFAVLNIMTGFFVDQALKAADADYDYVISEEMGERERVVVNLKNVFHKADAEGTSSISWSQLLEHLSDPKVQAYFKTLHLEVADLRTFFELAQDTDGEMTVNINQFVRACLRLKGPAKNADVVVLRHQVEALANHCAEMFDRYLPPSVTQEAPRESRGAPNVHQSQ